MSNSASLVGSVIERKGAASVPRPPKLNGTVSGFPAAKHRSQSAFARARNDTRKNEGLSREKNVPIVEPTSSPMSGPGPSGPSSAERDWRRQVEEENQHRVESMTEEEREQERSEILARFGPNIAEVLQRAREARESRGNETNQKEGLSIDTAINSPSTGKRAVKSAIASRPSSPPPHSANSTRPSSRTDRRLRFAELTPQDVHVYESAPPSPRKKALALLPPMPDDGPTVSLGSFNGPMTLPPPSQSQTSEEERLDADEGTPEYIRRRFFPSAAPNDPSLAWIEANANSSAGPSDLSLRFDLTGTPIPLELSSTLPTHLGLHHHAEGSHAGYTLDDLFLLSRSTVPAQRASMLDVLGRIARRIGRTSRSHGTGIKELMGQEASLRKRILAAGVEAMTERGTLGIRAIEVMWVCVVAWDEDLFAVEDVELKDFSSDGALPSIPLDFVLPQISGAFASGSLPQETLSQLLAIVHRLAQESADVATSVVQTKGLVANMVQLFLLLPYPPEPHSPLPEPFAIQVLTTLAQSSRSNASALVGPSDALLRFVLTVPSSSPYQLSLATSLLTATLHFYAALASYGLYAQIAATAHEGFRQIRQYVLSDLCQSTHLREAWLGLLEAWMVCARDPHMTTPDHDILWSQVVGWGWAEDVLALRQQLTAQHPQVWAALWRALAVWLEGVSVNGVRGGESEKSAVVISAREGFERAVEHAVIENCMSEIAALLQAVPGAVDLKTLADKANILATAIKLWLACLPSSSQQGLESPPFVLPFQQISSLCGRLTTHSLWDTIWSDPEPSTAHVHLRPLSRLLASYLDMSRVLPGMTEDLWLAQSLAILLKLLPGDEEYAVRIIDSVTKLINPSFMETRHWPVPPVVWEKKGLEPILPFLTYSLQTSEIRIGSVWMTPYSISASTTQRIPPLSSCRPSTHSEFILPMARDWPLSTLNYLLRSGQTDVFKSLPASWDASEVELVRASLLFARVSREVLSIHSLAAPIMSREETLFGCMKVFMLEHGQQQDSTTSAEEVFRDSIVGGMMNDLIAPFVLGSQQSYPRKSNTDAPLLETVAARFLGVSTPFYQFYTDFVGLYDAISFSHSLFARLLLPPLSMRYPIDYRKYLWVDYGHVMRTIRTPVESVVAGSLDEFLWPVENNAEILTGYLRALTKGHAEGFLRLVAVHHIAYNIWPDLRGEDLREGDEKAVKLLQAVVGQGSLDGVREVVLYKQSGEEILIPPLCFAQTGEWRAQRKVLAGQCGKVVKDRLEKLL